MKTLAFILLYCLAALPVGAETIDRVVAAVNGRPILQSEVDEAVRYEAFVEGKPLSKVDGAAMRAALDRLIDQELLRQQMGEMAPELSPTTLQQKVAELRTQHGGSEEHWRQALAEYGLDEAAFISRLEYQLRMMKFVDSRLRPSIVVERSAVETYYRDTLLPQLRKSGVTQEPSYNDVQHDIREVLTQQRIDEMLTTWLHNLRQQSKVRMVGEDTQVASRDATATAK